MDARRGWASYLAIVLLALGPLASTTWADGGTVRFSERRGAYQLTVFTAPNPFRAGPVDVSVLVQDAATGAPVADALVTVGVAPAGHGATMIRYPATQEAATNKLFHAAQFDLPAAGWWEFEVCVETARLGRVEARFQAEMADPLPRWRAMWPWVAWPVVPIALFCLHQLLSRRQRSGQA